MQQQRKLARGYKFRPTDEQLVGKYLYEKITGVMPLKYGCYVYDADMYGKEEPWEIWERYGDEQQHVFGEDLYFFTNLKKKSADGNGNRINRAVGSNGGCWHVEDSGSKIKADDGDIKEVYSASKRRFSYMNKGSNQHKRWIMHEYSLELGSGQNKSKSSNYLVLCRLRKKGGTSSAGAEAAEVDAIDSENRKRKPTTAAQVLMVTDDPDQHQCKRRRELQIDNNTTDVGVWSRMEQAQLPQPAGSLMVFHIDYDDDANDDQYCFSSNTSADQYHKTTEACLRVEQDQPKIDCVVEAPAGEDILGELGVCVPDDELFEEGARIFADFDASFTGKGLGIEQEQQQPNTNCVLEALTEDVFEELGLCVSDDFFDRATKLDQNFDENFTASEDLLRVEEEQQWKTNCILEAAEEGIDEEDQCPLELCKLSDEFLNDAARPCTFDDIHEQFTRGSMSLQEFLHVPCL